MTVPTPPDAALRRAAGVLAAAGLTDAFGHVSVRTGPEHLLITPPVPLGFVDDATELVRVSVSGTSLPGTAPQEAWLHTAVLRRRAGVGAVCRAQPSAVAALVAAGRDFTPATGHLAMLGPIPVRADSRLVRDPTAAEEVATVLADARAVVLRGNGALTVGPDLGSAVAAMWLLEQSARLLLAAYAAGSVTPLPEAEQADWQDRAPELLPRIYTYLLGREGT